MSRPADLRPGTKRRGGGPVGVMIHTTGVGIVDRAVKYGAEPFSYALGRYQDVLRYWAHGLIGWDGDLGIISDAEDRVPHCGMDKTEYQLLKSGEWKLPVNCPDGTTAAQWASLVRRWERRWGKWDGPLVLSDGRRPNDAYVGIEMLAGARKCVPNERLAGWFTFEQYEKLAKVIFHLSKKHDWNIYPWLQQTWHPEGGACPVVGHEDMNPLTRVKGPGGWDPGMLRATPRFDEARLRLELSEYFS